MSLSIIPVWPLHLTDKILTSKTIVLKRIYWIFCLSVDQFLWNMRPKPLLPYQGFFAKGSGEKVISLRY
jgi:hypothetical protein